MKSFLLLLGATCAVAVQAETLRLSGSTTVKGALEPKQERLEAAVGCPLEFFGNGTAAGLLSLVDGDADIAMISSPLADAVQMANQKQAGVVDAAQLRAHPIGTVRTLFIINPHNPVRSLKASQLADVLEGKVTNWREVGGADAPINVVSLANGGPLLEAFLARHDVTAKARHVPFATQIPGLVAADPNAIGIISAVHPRGPTTVLQTDADVSAPLALVTKGEPSAVAQKLIEAARQTLAAKF